MVNDLGPERTVHGQAWGLLHGGYFSDPVVARPLLEVICAAWAETQPDVMVDLGGGTGYLLSQVRDAGIGAGTALVNLENSEAQLEEAGKSGISSVCGSVDGFHRAEVGSTGRKALFLMRSVLHYAGEAGLTPLLRQIRAQAETGEFWVHQTACFEREEDAACLNALYRGMHTRKWYPTVDDLQARLVATGWQVKSILPAPVLHLDSADLGFRYGLNEAELQHIGEKMAADFGGQNTVFRRLPSGFQADLRYCIFTCSAGS